MSLSKYLLPEKQMYMVRDMRFLMSYQVGWGPLKMERAPEFESTAQFLDYQLKLLWRQLTFPECSLRMQMLCSQSYIEQMAPPIHWSFQGDLHLSNKCCANWWTLDFRLNSITIKIESTLCTWMHAWYLLQMREMDIVFLRVYKDARYLFHLQVLKFQESRSLSTCIVKWQALLSRHLILPIFGHLQTSNWRGVPKWIIPRLSGSPKNCSVCIGT